jgi:pimeloyl-ACP methyl ester carboxylesterase
MRDAGAVHGDAVFSDAAAWTVDGNSAAAPSMRLLLTEPARSLADLATLPLAASWLAVAPRGDGHGVLVLPGLLASDTSTVVMRRFLRRLGYQVRGWELGRNLGPTDAVLDEMPARLTELVSLTRRPVSVIGWSLGGIYARELARQQPALVRRVITLGSPFGLAEGQRSHADRAFQRRITLHANGRVPSREQVSMPISVPSTAVYSRRDGIVPWRACTEPETDLHQNVEVRCAHLGFGVDQATLWLIADRLALPASDQSKFRPVGPLRSLYPDARDE